MAATHSKSLFRRKAFLFSGLGLAAAAAIVFALIKIKSEPHPREQGEQYVRNYSKVFPDRWSEPGNASSESRGWLVFSSELLKLIETSNCKYIHASLALEESRDPIEKAVLVFTAVDNEYNHIFCKGHDVIVADFPSLPGYNTIPGQNGGGMRVNDFPLLEGSDALTRTHTGMSVQRKPITAAQADEWIARYIAAAEIDRPKEPVGWLIMKSQLQSMTETDFAYYLHFMRALKDTLKPDSTTMVIAAVDKSYHHQYPGNSDNPQVIESIYPCPECINLKIHPSGYANGVNSRLLPSCHLNSPSCSDCP